MIFAPFIYFCILFLFILIRKKHFELSALIAVIYMIISFFAVLIDVKDLYGSGGCVKGRIELVPTILFCVLISLTIIPFYKLKSMSRGNVIPIINLKLFNGIVYFFIVIYLLFLFFFVGEIIGRITDPDIATLRILAATEGDDLGFSRYSGTARIIARLVFIFASAGMFLQVLYFYSVAFLNKSVKYNSLILFCSTAPILIGILSLDRSKMVYWVMSFIAVYVFFSKVLDVKKKVNIRRVFFYFSCIFAIYLTTITVARYGDYDSGATDSLIIYAGQSFNNFCLFYDQLSIPGISLEEVLPVLNSIISSPNEISRADLYTLRNIDTNVFASFSGLLIREIGLLGSILYSLIYFIVVTLIFKRIRKYNITNIFLVVILVYIPYLGVFGLFYSGPDRVYSAWGVLILGFFLQKRFIASRRF
jgi:oligosaccharide repeat unit polymerase